jgi:hypothetical protein
MPSTTDNQIEAGQSDLPIGDSFSRIAAFARRFGEPHAILAMHAALPLGLTPELVHLIRVNFVSRAPWIAEADLLLSSLCRYVGGGTYEMDSDVRELLLFDLYNDPDFGAQRVRQLSGFLLAYTDRALQLTRPEARERQHFLTAQQWAALAYLQPEEAVQQLAAALSDSLSGDNRAEAIRIASLTQALAAPLIADEKVLVYTVGIERLAEGDLTGAIKTLSDLGPPDQSTIIGSISLPSPVQLAQQLLPSAASSEVSTGSEGGEQESFAKRRSLPLPYGVKLLHLLRDDQPITDAVWSRNNLMATTCGDEHVVQWDYPRTTKWRTLQAKTGQLRRLTYHPLGTDFAAAMSDHKIRIWGEEFGNEGPVIEGHTDEITDLAWSPDGSRIASTSKDMTTRIITPGGNPQTVLNEEWFAPQSVAWATTTPYLAIGLSNGDLKIWDARSGRTQRVLKGHSTAVRSITWSRNGAIFASGSDDRTIRIWRIDAEPDDEPRVLEGHAAGVSRLSFSPDGQILASKSYDDTIRLWRSSDWHCVAVIDTSAADDSHPVLAFHPSEPLLATCSGSNDALSILQLDMETLLAVPLPGAKKKDQPRVYISYERSAQLDQALARQISQALSDEYSIFLDRQLLVGADWQTEIRQADYLIVLLSDATMKSEHVMREVELALNTRQQQAGRPKVLPVRVAYHEPFREPWDAYFNHIQWAIWDRPSDMPRLIEELKRAISSPDINAEARRDESPPPRIFFAYKRNVEPDESTARQIAEALSERYDVFIDHKMPIGVEWQQVINEAFNRAEVLILLLTPESIRSEFVRLYIRRALERLEAQGEKLKIIPIRLAYHEPLPDELAALDRINHLTWEGPETTPRIINELLSSIEKIMAESHSQTPDEKAGEAEYFELAATGQTDDPNGGLQFVHEARVISVLPPSQLRLIDSLIEHIFQTTAHDEKQAIALFELLIPNVLKDRLSGQRGVILTVDQRSARYPWEIMARRGPEGIRLLSLEQEMIRRFPATERQINTSPIYGRDALIIGDTKTEYGEIPGAQKEAHEVAEAMRASSLNVELLIRPDARTVVSHLFSEGYRVIHLAGHGFDNGIPLGDGTFLTSAEFAQLRTIPELVFINCPHLGRINSDDPTTQTEPSNRTIASMVEQLIRIGVKAVIAAGWAIDDSAASTFATTFYLRLLEGLTFGRAVLEARRASYEQHPQSNTWGAYQCYGEPGYILTPTLTGSNR